MFNCGQLWPIVSKYVKYGQVRLCMDNYGPV